MASLSWNWAETVASLSFGIGDSDTDESPGSGYERVNPWRLHGPFRRLSFGNNPDIQ